MKPTVDKVIPLVWKLYERSHTGCCLHIVLDDGNVYDTHVEFCIEQAINNNHVDCLELGQLMLQMSKTQRLKLGARAYESRLAKKGL